MGLEQYTEKVTTKPIRQADRKALDEWDGRDFRGEKCTPKSLAYIKQNPVMFKWLRSRPRKTVNMAAGYLEQFFTWAEITPEKWLMLNKKKARDLIWDFIETKRFHLTNVSKAQNIKMLARSIYLYHNEEHLVWIKGKHDVIFELMKEKYVMNKQVVWQIIGKTRSLRDETLVTFAFESGLRRNAISHLTYGHYKHFYWFFQDEENKITKSDSVSGNLAVFKVKSQKSKDYVHDDKLRGKVNFYYACLHHEACEVIRKYVKQAHKDSTDDIPFWLRSYPPNEKHGISGAMIWALFTGAVKRAGLPKEEISFHALRRAFRKVVRDTAEIRDQDYKEFIMGHKLKGSQENYATKDPKEIAIEYAKCDFSPSTEMQKKLESRVKELEQKLVNQKKDTNNKLTNQQETIKQILRLIGKLGKDDKKIQNWHDQYLRDNNLENVAPAIPTEKDGFFTCQDDFKAYQVQDLPCIVDVNYSCRRVVCQEQVKKLVGMK